MSPVATESHKLMQIRKLSVHSSCQPSIASHNVCRFPSRLESRSDQRVCTSQCRHPMISAPELTAEALVDELEKMFHDLRLAVERGRVELCLIQSTCEHRLKHRTYICQNILVHFE